MEIATKLASAAFWVGLLFVVVGFLNGWGKVLIVSLIVMLLGGAHLWNQAK